MCVSITDKEQCLYALPLRTNVTFKLQTPIHFIIFSNTQNTYIVWREITVWRQSCGFQLTSYTFFTLKPQCLTFSNVYNNQSTQINHQPKAELTIVWGLLIISHLPQRWHDGIRRNTRTLHIFGLPDWTCQQETKMQGEEKERERKRDSVTNTAGDKTTAKDERMRETEREGVLAGLTCSRWEYTWEAAVS